MKVALYARVSTKTQEPETQLIPLREYTQRRGLTVFGEFVDFGVSGAKVKRPALDQVMAGARKRLFDAVIVARFDRMARSVSHLVAVLDEFNSLGIQFVSLNESIDTSTPMGRAMFQVIGTMAELERDLIRERINAGLARARAEGKKLGPPQKIWDREKARELRAQGASLRQLAKVFHVSKDAIAAALRSPTISHTSTTDSRLEVDATIKTSPAPESGAHQKEKPPLPPLSLKQRLCDKR